MAGSVNKVILVGNLGRDPEVRMSQAGIKIVNFSVATSERWRDKKSGEQREKTEWHRVVVFAPSRDNEGLAGVVEKYLKKGSKVYIEGSLQTDKWEKEGHTNYTTKIVLQDFSSKLVMLDSRGDDYAPPSEPSGGDTGGSMGGSSGGPGGGDLDDEIPF